MADAIEFKGDLARTARLWDIPFAMPRRFPVVTLATARAFYWLEEINSAQAVRFADAAFTGLFAEGRDIADRAVVAALLEAVGAEPEAGLAATGDPQIKERLKAATDEAVGRGVFGSPFIFVDGEPFWGADRLDQVDRWLERGGW